METTSYRVHAYGESLDSVLDHGRVDGWVASDESEDTRPSGVSACGSLSDLARYITLYSMNVEPGDTVLRLVGLVGPDHDRDQGAMRVLASSYEVVCTGAELLEAMELASLLEDVYAEMSEGSTWEDACEEVLGSEPTETVLGIARSIA